MHDMHIQFHHFLNVSLGSEQLLFSFVDHGHSVHILVDISIIFLRAALLLLNSNFLEDVSKRIY